MTLVTPEPTIARDRYGRPLITPIGGGKPIAYTRCTTFVDALDDKYGLQQWMMRMVAVGLAQRPDLMLSVAAHRDDKRELNKICEAAKEAAAASAAATTGTALHALTELIDRGQELPVLPERSRLDLEAYRAATAELSSTYIERFAVMDPLQIGGTPDRVVTYKGKRYIADIKTGSIEFGTLKIAQQLSVYARSKLYDIRTGERLSHGAEIDKGLIIHLPAGTGTCSLIWVDLLAGWQAVLVSRDVRVKRQLKFKDLTRPFEDGGRFDTKQGREELDLEPSLRDRIEACETAQQVRDLWQAHATEWDDDLTEVAKVHISQLPAAS